MPKQKTHKGTQKRIKITKTGKLKKRRAFRSHLLDKKSNRRKENYTKEFDISDADKKNVKKLLPYS
jgi:large subunit ribosomal protein L35